MTTRYQKQHYEDVARIVSSFIRIRITIPGGATGEEMADAFANLFAADNPRICSDCGDREDTTLICTRSCDAHHVFPDSFDRARFLAACGLEGEG